jgi:hypothetical protein
MRPRARFALALVCAAALGGCARPSWLPTLTLPSFGGDGPAPDAGRVSEVEVVESADVTEFYARATEFYQRLEGRRFNSIASFRDAGLRTYFENEQSFTDYYADLADDLAVAHFQRSVPLATRVDEFAVDGPGRARVSVRIGGRDGRPLRFWSTSLHRKDRWERRGGRWWIVPVPVQAASAAPTQ